VERHAKKEYFYILSTLGLQGSTTSSPQVKFRRQSHLMSTPPPRPTPPPDTPPDTPPSTPPSAPPRPEAPRGIDNSVMAQLPRDLRTTLENEDYGKFKSMWPLVSFPCFSLIFSPIEVIAVDIKNPERNREVFVYEFSNVEIDGVLHDGYEVVMEGDIRDLVKHEVYKAHLVSTNEIMIKAPSMSYSRLQEPELSVAQSKLFNSHCPRIQEAHDVARNEILDEESRRSKYLLLRFPNWVVLSNQVLSPESQLSEIEMQLNPYETSCEVSSTKYNLTVTEISWKVTVEAERKRVVKVSVDNTNKAVDKLTQLLAGMSTSIP
jgi:hypothetical protein